MIVPLLFVAWWLVMIEPQVCTGPLAAHQPECRAILEHRVRSERY